MDVVFALVAVSVVLVIAIAIVLIWAIRSGQFEDMEGPAWRVLMDDDRPIVRDEAHKGIDDGADDTTAKPADDKPGSTELPDAAHGAASRTAPRTAPRTAQREAILAADERDDSTPQDKQCQSLRTAMSDKDNERE